MKVTPGTPISAHGGLALHSELGCSERCLVVLHMYNEVKA